MRLSLPDALTLATTCAAGVAPQTLLAIVQVESGFDPLAIGVNGTPRRTVVARSAAEAAQRAGALIAAGRSVDLGLAQINSANLDRLGLSLDGAFDPCRNLAASARLLQSDYGRSWPASDAQAELGTMLSFYNTGSPRRGFANGYVARVTAAAAQLVPSLKPIAIDEAPATATSVPPQTAAPPAWDVFGETRRAAFVIRFPAPSSGDAP